MNRILSHGRWCLMALLSIPAMSGAATFTVNLTQDEPDALPGDGICSYDLFLDPSKFAVCTLRAAVMEGNATSEDESVTIRLTPGATYVLNTPELQPQGAQVGDLDITRPMAIGIPDGAAPRARIDGNQMSRIFELYVEAPNSRLYGLEITGGYEPTGMGAAIRSVTSGTVFENLDIHDNMAGDEPGADCAVYGSVTLLDSRVHHNGSEQKNLDGVCSTGPLTVARSTIDSNFGIGLNVQFGSLWLHSSTVSNNATDGIHLRNANATISNSTIIDNRDEIGSFAVADAVVNLILTGSIVDSGDQGVACVIVGHDQSTATLQAAWNLYSDASCVSNSPDPDSIVSEAIHLSELGDWGGPTPTHVPLEGSDAIDRAPEHVCDDIDTDQRGLPRPVATTGSPATPCDIGAVEVQQAPDEPADGPIFADGFEPAP